ncbi:unnamed protein product [Fraxinus pennsylvanica]|uniref:Uncharacterized protein n=1 Tax=Fraxinus pennsylvanica TaxID=56036 RepID=A0AAD1ZTD7_9LAMI|nr:unnamed protein product [Fraxinus pennsylvanica]
MRSKSKYIWGSVQVMGVKRIFDEEDFQELSFKQAKCVECDYKLTPFAENFPHYGTSPKVDLRGDGRNFCKLQLYEGLENDCIDAAFNVADKDLETSAPLSWVTSSSGDDSAGFENTSRCSHLTENFDFLDPIRGSYQFEDGYSSLFNDFPTRKVPIGLTYQADLPPWDSNVTRKDCSGSNCFVESEQKFMGTCIIPMPDLNTSTYNDVEVGRGRRDCSCLDVGSMRCMQQHVNEAREKLRETFGDKNFMELGFYEMGEDVAHKWTEEDELVYHEVIYSNPLSLGKRFWKHLAVVFPSRTKKEIVCYYFNVFILRRRSVQNRSKLLEIDSDDDEWQGTDGGFCRLEGEEEESIVESFDDQDIHTNCLDLRRRVLLLLEDEDEDRNSDGNDDVGQRYAIEMDDGASQMSRLETEKLHDGFRFDYKPYHLDGIPSKIEGDPDVEELFGLSSKTQSQMTDFMGSVGLGSVGQDNRNKNDHRKFSIELAPESESNDCFGFGFVMESCDANVWNGTNSDGNDDVGQRYAIEMDDGASQMSRLETEKLHDGFRFDYKPYHLDGIPSKIEGDLDVEELFGLSSKTQSQMTDFMGSVGLGSVGQDNRNKNDHRKFSSELAPESESNDCFGFGFVMESCDANVWSDTYSTGLMKSVDLLPTSNMIEEIFGPHDAWKSKSNNEKSIS